jgi:hypothetical protein
VSSPTTTTKPTHPPRLRWARNALRSPSSEDSQPGSKHPG